MAYRNLLVQLDETKANAGRVQAAIELAQAQQAHLTGLFVINEPDLPSFVRGQIPRDVIEQQRADSEDTARAANDALLAMADHFPLAYGGLSRGNPSTDTRLLYRLPQ